MGLEYLGEVGLEYLEYLEELVRVLGRGEVEYFEEVGLEYLGEVGLEYLGEVGLEYVYVYGHKI